MLFLRPHEIASDFESPFWIKFYDEIIGCQWNFIIWGSIKFGVRSFASLASLEVAILANTGATNDVKFIISELTP